MLYGILSDTHGNIEALNACVKALKKEAAIWHEMTVIEEMMPVYLEYGLK